MEARNPGFPKAGMAVKHRSHFMVTARTGPTNLGRGRMGAPSRPSRLLSASTDASQVAELISADPESRKPRLQASPKPRFQVFQKP
jgi:hypothetical protein